MTVFRLGGLRIFAATLLWSIPALVQLPARAQQGQAAPAGAQAPTAAPAKPQTFLKLWNRLRPPPARLPRRLNRRQTPNLKLSRT
jgi:hypothetical protein